MSKLTKEHIESLIIKEDVQQVGTKTTVCVLTLKNGFEVIGTASCIDPDDYDIDIGKKYAREDAIDQLFELEAYKAHG